MALSPITHSLGLVTLLGSSLSALQATESLPFDDLPEDAVLHVMRFLPDRDITGLGQTSRTQHMAASKALDAMIHQMTLNRGTGEDPNRLQDLPILKVQQILGQIIEKDQYLAVPMNSPLCTIIPETLKLADLADWREQLPLAMLLYEAAFGKDLPENSLDLALQHLLAVLDTRVYVQRSNVNESFARFAANKSQDLIQNLQNQRQVRPFVNLLHGDVDGAFLAAQAHTIVLSDAELGMPETKQKLEQLLATQTSVLTHPVVINVGNNPLILQNGKLCFHRGLPLDMHHLTVTNPAANVRIIGEYSLAKQKDLNSLHLAGFQKVTEIANIFLSKCSSLTSVDLSSLRNVVHIGTNFLSEYSGLTIVDFSAFKNVTEISHDFLSRCRGLTSVDLSAFKNVTSIGSGFLSGCCSLTSVDLSAFKNSPQLSRVSSLTAAVWPV